VGARLSAVVLPAVEDPEDGYELTHPRYEYEYDDYGNVITITDKLKQTPDTNQVDANSARETTFTYDHLGNQVSRKLPSGKVETKEYNEHGQLIKSTDFKKQVTGYVLAVQAFYDSNSDYPDDPNWQYEFTYDNHGRRVTIDVNSFAGTPPTYKNYYDEQGRVHRIDSPYGTICYEHSDITGQVTSVYTPAGTADTEIANYYDELGRLAKVEAKKLNSEPASDITQYTYNPVGSLETVTYPNGNVSEYTYNAVNRLTNLTNWQSSARVTPLSRYQYTLSPDGQRTKAIETTAAGSTEIAWTYDDLNRLIAEDYNAPGDVNDYSHEYVYDIVGNRLERNVLGSDPNTTYSYNDNDQLTWETTDSNTITYGYDDNGALVLRDSNDGDDVTYSYDLRGRLAQADIENGPTVDYLYNPDGMRVRATVDGDDIDYIIDPYNHTGYAQVLKEINGVTGTNRVYVTGLDVVAQATGSSSPKYLLYDGHGSVRQLANNVGNVVANYHYDAYGQALNFNPAQAATQLLYAGEMIDPQTGLYNNRARWYNPVTGRFNRMDPFAGANRDPQSLHKYLYCHANPINSVDPSGQFTGTLIELVHTILIQAMVKWMIHGAAILGALTKAVYVTAGLYVVSNIGLLLIEWGYLPDDIQGYIEAVRHYSGVGFILSLAAFMVLSTLPDPGQRARPPRRVPRLPRDRVVDGRPAPDVRPTSRSVADNPAINAEKNRDVMRLKEQGAMDVRVNQRQVKLGNGGVVQKGWNRPDTQGTFQHRRSIAIEYDTRLARLIMRRDRILANNPVCRVILKWFAPDGSYTIVP
jgi:RHS repeat-associated protein